MNELCNQPTKENANIKHGVIFLIIDPVEKLCLFERRLQEEDHMYFDDILALGGGLETETITDGLFREVMEETSVVVKEYYYLGERDTVTKKGNRYKHYLFLIIANKGEIVNIENISQHMWLSMEDVFENKQIPAIEMETVVKPAIEMFKAISIMD